MSNIRIYLDKNDCVTGENSILFITGDTFHYLSRVLRIRKGQSFIFFDGSGNEYTVSVENCGKSMISCTILSSSYACSSETPFTVRFFQCIPKGSKMDNIVRDITQLGVKEIIPVVSRRTMPVSANDISGKIQRWEKIAVSSAGVSGRSFIPNISLAVDLKEGLESKSDLSILFWEGQAVFLRDIFENVANSRGLNVNVFIGPEGGFDSCEIEYAKSCGVKIASMGDRILKVETASVIAAALTIYELACRV